MPRTPADLVRYYARRAREYDAIYDKPERQADLARLRGVVPGYFADRDVLEIACGTGYWTQWIAPAARSITATDINEDTLAIARSRAYPADRVTFQAADVYALPPGLGNFSAAFAGFWWSHVPRAQVRAFIAALHAALVPGAVVVLLDNLYVEGSSTPLAHRDAEGDTYQRRRLADRSEHLVLKNFPTESELRRDLEASGTAFEYTALDFYWVMKYQAAG